MTRNRTFRPRISREERDRVQQLASTLNGAEITGGFPQSLELLLRYFDVLLEDVDTCPECGSDVLDWARDSHGSYELSRGKWRCPECGVFDVWDYLNVENREGARFPGFKEEIRYAFEDTDNDRQESDSASPNTGTNQGHSGLGLDW